MRTAEDVCGTYSGAQRHRKRGERPVRGLHPSPTREDDMSTDTYTPAALDADVKRYQQLKAMKDDIEAEQSQILSRIRELGLGHHTTPSGVPITISAPNRRFNLDKATQLLPDEVLTQCRADGFDSAKVKRFLSPELLDMCMDAGTGDLRVVVKA